MARTQEQVNFMLVGVFELLAAKQEQFDAYQEYLEAVRDYWLARVELGRAVGSRLPSASETSTPLIGVEQIVPTRAATDHHHHGHTDHERDASSKAPTDHGKQAEMDHSQHIQHADHSKHNQPEQTNHADHEPEVKSSSPDPHRHHSPPPEQGVPA